MNATLPQIAAGVQSGESFASSPELDLQDIDELRIVFAGQARLLASRAERALPLDARSIRSLLRVYRQLMLEEAA